MKIEDLRPIFTYSVSEGYHIMSDICNRIYIARHITLNNDKVIEELDNIGRLFRAIEHPSGYLGE